MNKQPIFLTNTLSKQKEEFKPITEGKVLMYHCGPTVYDFVHIGNLRAFLLADTVRRLFEWNGYEINQVMNITDIGHLVSDGDSGEDKMTKMLRRRELPITLENMLVCAEEYNQAFKQDLQNLNINIPNHMPKASDHIPEDIEIIKKLEGKGFTYSTSDGLYFDTSKMSDYGKLGGISKADESESRIGGNSEKRNQADFSLWKFNPDMGWESPWGTGFPGWHIECSGMSMKYLGETFDIHTGGHDLASIHHNNEIAQSECSTGKPFVHYWLHNEFVNIDGAKMAKSGANFITLRTLIEKNIDPLAYRYLILQSHYRSQVSFTWDSLGASETSLHRLRKQVANLPDGGIALENFITKFTEYINDDLNTAKALAAVFELLSSNEQPADIKATILKCDEFLGLKLDEISQEENAIEISAELQDLLNKRQVARDGKNWKLSDELRDQIKQEFGFTVKDTNEGQKLERI